VNSMWRSTMIYAVNGIIGSGIMCVFWSYRAVDLADEVAGGLLCMGLIILALHYLRKQAKVELLSSIFFLLTTVIISVVICLNHEKYIRSHWPFEPFVGVKIIAAFIPLICPPKRWAGLCSLALLALFPLQRYYSWEPSAQMSLGIQEPWVTTAMVCVATAVYLYRLKLTEVQHAEVKLAVKLESLRQFAKLLLGTQHLLNTPLQTIELLTRNGNGSDPESRATLEKSFNFVRQLTKILSLANVKVQLSDIQLPSNPRELELELKSIVFHET
jgi:hypothetical protein